MLFIPIIFVVSKKYTIYRCTIDVVQCLLFCFFCDITGYNSPWAAQTDIFINSSIFQSILHFLPPRRARSHSLSVIFLAFNFRAQQELDCSYKNTHDMYKPQLLRGGWWWSGEWWRKLLQWTLPGLRIKVWSVVYSAQSRCVRHWVCASVPYIAESTSTCTFNV